MIKKYISLAIASIISTASIANQVLNVANFGAVSDGKTISTKAFQKALDSAFVLGGAKVIVPKGVFMVGTIFIKSNTTFEIEQGAKILGSPSIKDYTEMTWGGDGNRDRTPYHLIVAKGQKNITIQGEGTVDGNGRFFWKNPDVKLPAWIYSYELRTSPMIEIQDCEDIKIKDVLFTNPSGWTLHLLNCDRVVVDGIRINNNVYSPNSDGIDITGSRDVIISNCQIKTCDDGICLKTSPDAGECKRITVTNCVVETLCAALKIGNESYKDISQVTFSNCIVYNSSRAIGLYSENGGKIEDVIISNIVCDNKVPLILNRPIHISLLNKNPEKHDIGAIKNIVISNIIATTNGRILLTAAPGAMLENITLKDIQISYPLIEDPFVISDSARSFQYSPKNKNARKQRASIIAENIKNLVVENVHVNWPIGDIPKDWQIPVKIENGPRYRTINPEYKIARECEMGFIWGNNIQGGYFRNPLSVSSIKSIKKYQLKDSKIKILD